MDVYADVFYEISLELSQDESIRNTISDGKNICISILDERDTESFTTKKTIHYISLMNHKGQESPADREIGEQGEEVKIGMGFDRGTWGDISA